MFCMKCGAEIKEGAAFCSNCGQAVTEQKKSVHTQGTSTQKQSSSQPKTFSGAEDGKSIKSRKKSGIIIGTAAAAVVIVVAIIIAVTTAPKGRSYEETIDEYLTALYDEDIEAYINLIPEPALEVLMKRIGIGNAVDPMETFIYSCRENMSNYEYYLDFEPSSKYEIERVHSVSDSELKNIQDAWDIRDVKVSDAINVEVRTFYYHMMEELSDVTEISLIKVGKSWYLDEIKESGPWDWN